MLCAEKWMRHDTLSKGLKTNREQHALVSCKIATYKREPVKACTCESMRMQLQQQMLDIARITVHADARMHAHSTKKPWPAQLLREVLAEAL